MLVFGNKIKDFKLTHKYFKLMFNVKYIHKTLA